MTCKADQRAVVAASRPSRPSVNHREIEMRGGGW